MSPFPALASGYPFPALEREILEEWRRNEIFRRTLERNRATGRRFVFFEGPPTANNVPHVGHVVTRVVKDLFPRFRTMQGYQVERKAGWDTHGLAVEIEVEKRLGFSGKKDIERYGVAEFNRQCLESVHTYKRQWRAMSERVGFWLDFDNAYTTYSNRYIESVWWALARLFDQELLTTNYKVQPYCARCGTTLSSHEVAQNYKDADDPSVWVLFPVRPGQKLPTVDGGEWTTPEGLMLVAWTTTPWTLPGHAGLAVNPGLTYVVVEHPGQRGTLLLFAERLESPVPLDVEGGRKRIDLRDRPSLQRIPGSALSGRRYDRPFPGVIATVEWKANTAADLDQEGWRVLTADYVTRTDGTGIVHTAPAFGEDDFASGAGEQLPFLLTVDERGTIAFEIDPHLPTDPRSQPMVELRERINGLHFKAADREIMRYLREQGLLLHADRHHHSYPFCWRCDQPLLYYATPSWFILTTERKQELIDHNRRINWYPAHVGEGRFGTWLENVVDWALSRRRYWGTPLPIWQCDQGPHAEAVGSFAKLFEKAGTAPPPDPYDRDQFDPHRPFIDGYSWPCGVEGCGGTMRRVPEVIDAWFDSGAMPFAQHHYPFENPEKLPDPDGDPATRTPGTDFPADFISEAVDQTRGWFYTLHVLGVLLFQSEAFRNCIVLGHVNDEQGRKMSKRLGNVLEPMGVIEETGADALRWYFYVNNPEQTARFSARLVRESAQRFLIPLWNAASFFTIYANMDGWRPVGAAAFPFQDRPALDRWILLRLDRLLAETTGHLDGYRVTEAARGVEAFVDDLTNWYIRRSRDRFWAPAAMAGADKESAYRTLYETLSTLARLLAPFTPFLAEALHRHLHRGQDSAAAASVHLEDWPQAPGNRCDRALEEGMQAVLRAVRLGHAARNGHGIRVRQPLPAVTLVTADQQLRELVEPHLDVLRDELNVREIAWAADRSLYVRQEVKPVWSKCGPRFGKRMQLVKRALEAADGDAMAAALEGTGKVALEVDGETVELTAGELEVRLVEREGMATQGDGDLLVALDTALTPELIAEGWAREVVHRIQTARKAADLDYADRIRVRYAAGPELAAAIRAHHEWIAGETLAIEVAAADGDGGAPLEPAPLEGMDFAVAIERV